MKYQNRSILLKTKIFSTKGRLSLKIPCTVFFVFVSIFIFNISENLYSKDQSYDTNKMYSEWETIVYTGSIYELDNLEEKVISFIQKDPNNVFMYYLMSCLYLRKASLSYEGVNTGSLLRKSVELTQHIVELSSDIDLGYISMARNFMMFYQKDQAKQLIEESMFVIDDPSWRVYFTLALISLENRDYTKAKKYTEQALSFRNSNLDILVPYFVDVLKLYYHQDLSSSGMISDSDMNSYLKELYTWNKVYPHPYFWEQIATVLSAKKEYRKAHEYFEKIHKKVYRNSISAYMSDAKLVYEHLKNYKLAKSYLDKVINYEDIEHYLEVKSLAYLYLGDINLRNKKLDEAESYFSLALTESDFKSEIYMNSLISLIHDTYLKHNSIKNFASLLESVLEEKYLSENVYMYLSHIYSNDIKDYNKALEYINDAIVLDVRRGDFYNEAGLIYYRVKDLARASAMFSVAIELDPTDATARYNKACVLSMLGNIEDSYDSLEKAIMLKPDLYQLSLKDDDLKNLVNSSMFARIKDPNSINNDKMYSNRENDMGLDEIDSLDDLDFIESLGVEE